VQNVTTEKNGIEDAIVHDNPLDTQPPVEAPASNFVGGRLLNER